MKSLMLACACLTIITVACGTDAIEQWNARATQPWVENPRYWQYNGEPVLLVGGSKTDHLFLADSLKDHLDEMAAIGANYVRCTMSQREDVELKPYKLLPDGTFDLDQWNNDYWQWFSDFLNWTREREIIVQIEVWDRFDYSQSYWQHSPWRPAININYAADEIGFDDEYPKHPGQDLQPFFHSIPGMPNYSNKLDRIRQYQETFVDKMLSYSLDFGNVLYCMNNETGTPVEWGKYWMQYIQTKAREKSRSVYTTDMFNNFFKPQECQRCQDAIKDSGTYMFLDVSQNNSRNFGQKHWDTLQWIMNEREKYPLRPVNNTKIYGGGHKSFGTGSNADGVARLIRNILGGCASGRHHRPTSGAGLNDAAKASIKAIRAAEQYVKFWDVTPRMDLLEERGEDEAYITAQPGVAYVVFFPAGGDVTLNLTGHVGVYTERWISVADGTEKTAYDVQDGGKYRLTTQDNSGWIVVIVKG